MNKHKLNLRKRFCNANTHAQRKGFVETKHYVFRLMKYWNILDKIDNIYRTKQL